MLQQFGRHWPAMTLGAAIGVLCPAPVAAQTSANLAVTATVVANCSVSAGTLAFGNYDPTAGSPVDATASVGVTCTQGTVASVGLDTGTFGSGGQRRMSDGSAFLAYDLFKDAGRTDPWGDSGGARLTLAAAPSSAARAVTVYGRVAASQDLAIGAYTDTVVVTVTF
jgi:spore coat protein U-like protein